MIARNHLIFSINQRLCAVDIQDVDQVVRAVEPITVPESPPPIRGLINFRGDFLPLLDLREYLGFPPRSIHPDQRFLILSHGSSSGILQAPADETAEASMHELEPDANHGRRPQIRKMALIADDVLDVLAADLQLSTGTEQALSGCQGFISHVGKIDGKAVLIFDMERLWTKVFRIMKNGEQTRIPHPMNGDCEDGNNGF